jgi:CBS domain-containing protein
MPVVNEIMSTAVQLVAPGATLRQAAQMMLEQDVGALPVCEGNRLLGMVTDRDITVRGVAAGLLPDTACVSDVSVSDVMTQALEFCTEDQDTEDVMHTMGHAQVRRLPVVNLAGELVGIVSLGDMARRQPGPVDQTVRDISEPTP